MREYPKEFFIEIEDQPEFLGRITLTLIKNLYNAEIDIVLNESRKIFKHIAILYNKESEEEAINNSMQMLAKFLKTGK